MKGYKYNFFYPNIVVPIWVSINTSQMPSKTSLQFLFRGETIISPGLRKAANAPKYSHSAEKAAVLLITDASLHSEVQTLLSILTSTDLLTKVSIATIKDFKNNFSHLQESTIAYFSLPSEFAEKYHGRKMNKDGKNLFIFPSPQRTLESNELKNKLWTGVLKPLQ